MKNTKSIQIFNFILVLLILSLFNAHAGVNNTCEVGLESYEAKFGGYVNNQKFSNNERLKALTLIENECKAQSFHTLFVARVLDEKGEYNEALSVLNDGIKRMAQPLGNLYFYKAQLMRRLAYAQVQNIKYEAVIKTYKQALAHDNTFEAPIYLGLAETAVLMSDFEVAYEYLDKGINIDSRLTRFITLASVIASKQADYQKAMTYIKVAAQRIGDRYLEQPDVVLALVLSLCKLGEEQMAREGLARAIAKQPESVGMPDIIEAKKVVNECK